MTKVDLSHRLSSGITIGEAAQRAEAWWGEWRGAVNRQFTISKTERVKTGAGVPLLKVKSEETDRAVGNILLGAPWEDLTAVEKATVTKYWHDGVFLMGHGHLHPSPAETVN